MKLLVTAFDPFGGEKVNPAEQAVTKLPDRIKNIEILKLTVPTVFGKSIETAKEAIRRLQPDAVLSVGQAGGRACITVERIAVNCMDARIADNEGNRPEDESIVPDGPAAYFATVPVKRMVRAIREAGLPAAVSDSAGTFVCNQLMYGLLHAAACGILSKPPAVGFLHVPYTTQQTAGRMDAQPSMALSDIVRGLEAAAAALDFAGWDEA